VVVEPGLPIFGGKHCGVAGAAEGCDGLVVDIGETRQVGWDSGSNYGSGVWLGRGLDTTLF